MKAFDVVLAPQAENDIAEALEWYRARSAVAADAFRADALATIDGLSESPTRWRVLDGGVRRCVLRRFPYSVVFEVLGTVVTVLAVAHDRRQPGYWRGP